MTEDDAKVIEEIRQLLERMVVPRFDAIDRQLEDLIKRVDSMEAGMGEFRRAMGWPEAG